MTKKKHSRGRLVDRICQNPECGKPFKTEATRVKLGKGCYHDLKCYFAHMRKQRAAVVVHGGRLPWATNVKKEW